MEGKNLWRETIQITTEVENLNMNHLLKSCCGPFFIGKKFSDNISKLFLNKKKRNEFFPLTLQRLSTAADICGWSLIMGIDVIVFTSW